MLLVVASSALACDVRQRQQAVPLVVERDTIGDTIVVRTVAGSAWGDAVRLEEELRVDSREGAAEYAFGRIGAMAVGADGTMYVYDGAMTALRAYDARGRHVRAFGREGSGPGEFRTVLGLAALADGRLLVRDAARIVVYAATGEPIDSWPVRGGIMLPGRQMLVADTAGGAFTVVPLAAEMRGGTLITRQAHVRLDGSGHVLDTLYHPEWPDLPPPLAPFSVRGITALHPHGGVVAARSDAYTIELRHRNGRVLRVERARQPAVDVHPEELAERQAFLDELARRNPDVERIVVPTRKPLLRQLHVAADGRLWVQPHVAAVAPESQPDGAPSPLDRPNRWLEPEVWDVFDPGGAFLGRLTPPSGATLHVMRGEHAWGTILDEDDVPSLVRWRIAP